MISRKAVSIGAASTVLYFAVIGVQSGLLLIGSIASFLTGGRAGCSSRVSRVAMLCCFVIILFLTPSTGQQCSREKSRHARAIVNKQIMPKYSLQHTEMPTTCPFSPANDMYAAQEVMRRRLGSSWMCSVCGKTFTEEHDLDSHLISSHKVHKVEGCLADYCDILRCEPIFGPGKGDDSCNVADMAKLRQKCMKIVRDACSSPHLSPNGRQQLELSVQSSICSYLTCEDYWTVAEELDTGTHYYYTIYAISFCVLLVFLVVYFKVASANIEQSMSMDEILAESDKYERLPPAVIPPDDDMEIRHRGAVDRQWSENE